jgi:hypothetical protein
MKKIILVASIISILLACDSNDDSFYNRVYLTSESELVNIVVGFNPNYSVGDQLFITATIPQILNVTNQAENIDLKRTTNAPSFNFSFVLERNNGGVWELVDVSNLIVANAPASAVGGYFVEATAPFDEAAAAYRFNGGLLLNQAGEYRLSFTYNNSLANIVELFSNSTGNNIRVSIKSPNNQVNAEGFYQFTVQ